MKASFIDTKRPASTGRDFNEILRSHVETLRNAGDNFNAEQQAKKTGTAPLNQRGGRWNLSFDLSDSRFTGGGVIEVPMSGWGLVYSIQGSDAGGVLDFDFDAGGVEEQCEPGAVLKGPFSGFRIRRNALSMTVGTVRIRLLTEPDADYGELAKGITGGALGNPSGGGIGPAGATTQAYNSAAGNIPTAATDGLSLVGVTGVRANVISAVGSTMTVGVGLLVWWQYDTVTGLWGETDMTDVPLGGASATARRIWIPNDKQIWVPEGRIYPELRSATNSAGSGSFTVRLYTWGT